MEHTIRYKWVYQGFYHHLVDLVDQIGFSLDTVNADLVACEVPKTINNGRMRSATVRGSE